MVEIIKFPQEEEIVLQCDKCGGQSFLVLASHDGNRIRVIGFECLTCATREFIEDA